MAEEYGRDDVAELLAKCRRDVWVEAISHIEAIATEGRFTPDSASTFKRKGGSAMKFGLCRRIAQEFKQKAGLSPITPEVIAKFWSHVDRSGECWEWMHTLRGAGYGHFQEGIPLHLSTASKFAWVITNGEIPKGLCVCHRCNNKPCVRPDHLYLATSEQNIKDAHRDGLFKRKTHCRKGHSLTDINNLVNNSLRRGWHACLICHKESRERWRKQKQLHSGGERP